ncbi:uncharacterized protein LY89DRAFT_713605 [Mollisia scopiformis]|uniref:Uncharacterized protein n=1 Tax=Mollisia scopiformis TaxID=149040 RepID=A0A194XTP2_MOLSC|nr:uncharacterized protein LY89DRAFT_713605 [Mollisia scopiformis]KUJ23067.1 hypothetical protein LY89DRAFT_713605 [Mollisia scopiformis]
MSTLVPHMCSENSLNSLLEPIMCCSEEDCTYSFGPACESCTLILKIREQRRQNLSTDHHSNKHSPKFDVNATGQLFFDGTSNDTSTKAAEDFNADLDSEFQISETRSFDAELPSSASSNLQTFSYPYTDTTSTTQPNSTETSISQTLDPWLSTLFDHTLAGHISGTAFVGGAEEQNPTENACPLCSKPVGDPRDQHLLRL